MPIGTVMFWSSLVVLDPVAAFLLVVLATIRFVWRNSPV